MSKRPKFSLAFQTFLYVIAVVVGVNLVLYIATR